MTRETGTIVRLRDMDAYNVYTNYMTVLLQVNGAASVERGLSVGQQWRRWDRRRRHCRSGRERLDAGARSVTADVVRQERRLERAGYRPAASENDLLAEHDWPGSRVSHHI